MATYAIGDIHGDSRALGEVLAQIAPLLAPDDVVVPLGDYVDRGPDSRGVLEQLIALQREAPCRVEPLLGNHEQWLLRTYRDPTRHSWLMGMEGLTTVASYSPDVADALRAELAARGAELLRDKAPLPYARFFEQVPASHLGFLQGLQPYARTPDVVCVHGGAESERAVEEQDVHTLVWGADGFPDDYAGERLVYGHRCDGLLDARGRTSPRVNAQRTAFGIDTIQRGVLTCLRFPDLAVFQSDPAWAHSG